MAINYDETQKSLYENTIRNIDSMLGMGANSIYIIPIIMDKDHIDKLISEYKSQGWDVRLDINYNQISLIFNITRT